MRRSDREARRRRSRAAGEPEDIDRSGGEPHNRDHRHDDRQNRRRPGNEQAGARDHERKREDPARLILVWRTDAVRTPTAIPVPSSEQDQVEVGAFTGDDLIDEDRTSGTSMPPPITPVARPMLTARTIGLTR